LTNVHRHSGSPSAVISLQRKERDVLLSVQDFGRGLPRETFHRRTTGSKLGVGIAGMQERVRQFRGQLDINGGPKGTRVLVTIPIAAPSRLAPPA
jgi:signal transduction histidine kinase